MVRVTSFFTLALLPSLLFAYSGGPDDALTNSPPNRQNCTNCHSSFGFNSGQGSLRLTGLPESYQPGETYRLSLELADPGARRWGFELTSLNADNGRGGNIAVVNQNNTQLSGANNRPQYLKHRSNGTFPNQANSATWPFDWTAPAEGSGRITLYAVGNAANNNGSTLGDRIYGAEFSLTEAEPPPPPPRDTLRVTLMAGWNTISSSVDHDSSMVADIFVPLIESGALTFMRNGVGEMFIPAEQVDEIGEWENFEGYQIKLSEEAEFDFWGEFVDPAHTYTLRDGWNWISYPRNDTLNPAQLFENFGFSVAVIRDGQGNFAVPGMGLSTLPLIKPGDGLQFFGDAGQPIEFVWPEPAGEIDPPVAPPSVTHFEAGMNTGASMSLVITGWSLRGEISDGDEVGVSTSGGMPVGAAVVMGERLLMTVWGDDNTTGEVDGAVPNDSLVFTYWYSEGDSEEVTIAMNRAGEQIVYLNNSFLEINLSTPPDGVSQSGASSPAAFELHGLYPNPFNPSTELSFSVSQPSFVSIGMFNISGQLIRDFGVSYHEAGMQRVSLNGSGLPAGVYLVGVRNEGQLKLTRALILK